MLVYRQLCPRKERGLSNSFMWVTLSQENGEFLSKEVTPPHQYTCIIFSCQKNPGYLLGSGYLIYNFYLKGLLALYPLPAGARVGSGAGRQTSPLISLNHQSPSRREMASYSLVPRENIINARCVETFTEMWTR